MLISLLLYIGGGMVAGLCVFMVTQVMAQPAAPPTALAQCQSMLRVKQDVVTYAEQLAGQLLLRAEKAEQELVIMRQQLEAFQPAPTAKEQSMTEVARTHRGHPHTETLDKAMQVRGDELRTEIAALEAKRDMVLKEIVALQEHHAMIRPPTPLVNNG